MMLDIGRKNACERATHFKYSLVALRVMASATEVHWNPMEFNDARKTAIKTTFDNEAKEGKLPMRQVFTERMHAMEC